MQGILAETDGLGKRTKGKRDNGTIDTGTIEQRDKGTMGPRDIWTVYSVQGVPLKSPPLNFSKCQIVENMAES